MFSIVLFSQRLSLAVNTAQISYMVTTVYKLCFSSYNALCSFSFCLHLLSYLPDLISRAQSYIMIESETIQMELVIFVQYIYIDVYTFTKCVFLVAHIHFRCTLYGSLLKEDNAGESQKQVNLFWNDVNIYGFMLICHHYITFQA